MTTQINITVGDQRLVQNVKTRAAANQQALDDRQQTTRTETKTTTAVKQTVERRNGVPQNEVASRPAAQRRKKEETLIYAGLQRRSLFTVTGSEESAAIKWEAPYALSGVWTTKTVQNTYSVRTTRAQPILNQVYPNTENFAELPIKSELYEVPDPYDITLNTTSLAWTIRQYFINAPNLTVNPTRRDGRPPAFPFNWSDLKRITNYRSMIMSCTETQIYLSQGFRVYTAPPSFLNGINDPNAYKVPTFPGQLGSPFTLDPVPGAYLHKTAGGLFGGRGEFVFYDIAFYYIFNVVTKTQTTRQLNLTDLSETSPTDLGSQTPYPYLAFYQNLDPLDPHADLFATYIKNYSSLAQKTAASTYTPTWPSSLRYNKLTGEVLVFASPPQGYTGNLRSLMSLIVDKNLSYTQVSTFLPPSPPFTRTVLEYYNFKFVNDYNISAGSSLYDQVFPVVING